jgi:hypothetical protein
MPIAPIDALRTEWSLFDVGDKSCWMHGLLSQHWSYLQQCWAFHRPQMRSEQYAFIWLQLLCDSGLGSTICVEIRRSRACQEQVQRTQISIRSSAYWLFQAPCQRCLPRRCVWRETTYGTYVPPKHSATVQNSLAPLKACLIHTCIGCHA